MPCETLNMDSTEPSKNELEGKASELSTKTTESSVDEDQSLCIDGNGTPYLSGPSPQLMTAPSASYPNLQRPLYPSHAVVAADSYPASAVSQHSSVQHHLDAGSFPSSFAGGAFRALSAANAADVRNGFHGSAFVPASSARCGLQNPKLEPGLESSSGALPTSPQQGQPFHLQIKEEDAQKSFVDNSTSDLMTSDATTTDDNCRTLRKVKKRAFSDTQAPCCPVCGVTVRPSELPGHFHHEVCRLEKVARSVQRPSRENTPQTRSGSQCSTSPSGCKRRENVPETNTAESRWESYERIKNNRNNRLTARANRGKKKGEDEATCPVCSQKVNGTPEELNGHVEMCLRKQKESFSDDEPVDVEGDETFEEYDWAGETRIRATSLVSGGLSSLGFQMCKKTAGEDEEDLDLNVDGDDTATFGQPQYSEADVIPCRTDEPSENRARQELRQAVLRNNESPTNSAASTTSKWSSIPQDKVDECTTTIDDHTIKGGDSTQVISSLKLRIAELEAPNLGKLKCLICMEPYTKPVVSISCWHVHCEECWLRTLGVKKLCPQCNTITSPTDLRIVYL